MAEADQTSPFIPIPGFGQTQMQRLIRLHRQTPIDRDQICRSRDLARDDDLIRPETAFESHFCGLESGDEHAIVQNLFRGLAQIPIGVLLHLAHDQFLVERTAVDTDAHWRS